MDQAVATRDDGKSLAGWILPNMTQEELAEEMEEALMPGETFSFSDLVRYLVPSGQGEAFVIKGGPPVEGSVQPTVESVEGIIIGRQALRRYYENKYRPGQQTQPPDCFSPDSVVGFGKPGGYCRKCPYSKFGSSKDSERGQACRQYTQIYIVEKDSVLPSIIIVPPTSLTRVSSYTKSRIGRGGASGVVTRFSLSPGGTTSLITAVAVPGETVGPSARSMLKGFYKSFIADPQAEDGSDPQGEEGEVPADARPVNESPPESQESAWGDGPDSSPPLADDEPY